MKKIGIILAILIVLLLILLYSSVLSSDDTAATDIIVDLQNIEETDFKSMDSVLVAASSQYTANDLKRFVQGDHYREAWSTPIKVPIVFLDTLYGGMKVIEEGGGKQTNSLKLQGANGIVYTLRSIAKDPEALVPEYVRFLGLENIVIDGVSAQHPYGAWIAAEMANALNILHTHPKAVFVPKQESLEDFNDAYGNKLYWLEYETEGKKNWTIYKDVVELMDTEDLQQLKTKHGQHVKIDVSQLVRNRLFDLVIGDWDRHVKQWGWAVVKNNNEFIGIPIPGDRDNAFFDIDGIVPQIVSSKNVEPHVRPFKPTIDYIPGLVYPFDRYFLLSTPESIYLEEAQYIQKHLTDSVIETAVSKWPEPLQKLNGDTIISKIKRRRDDLKEYALEFRKSIESKGVLTAPLNGSQDLVLPPNLLACFNCKND
ncbi:hypothetical protein [Altibacter sp.]|uniref:hypothetical protein n=1 Tax=Altibacter sp. TaxID=2024823 RepID=UPI000C8DAEFC|nr:hypothetical protein [Altibacter sp.]MAP56013.1 hypothetical protein [Altibacter sp.]